MLRGVLVTSAVARCLSARGGAMPRPVALLSSSSSPPPSAPPASSKSGLPPTKPVAYRRPWYQRLLGLESRKSVLSDNTLRMFKRCARQLDDDALLKAAVTAHNKSEMYAWFQSAVLHVWLCLGRMYTPPIDARELMSQEMSDHFFAEVERKLVQYGVTNPLAFNREYKRLAQIFHGTCVAYDKAYLAKDDEMFGRAVWRNLLNQDSDTYSTGGPSDDIVAYIKHQKAVLHYCDPEAFQRGEVPFASFADAMAAVKEASSSNRKT